jgi:hypothetical protein
VEGRSRRGRGDSGFITPAFIGVVGLTMVMLVMAANLLVVHYAGGVLQASVEEGARQGVAAGAAACAVRAQSVIDGGLGVMAADVGPVACTVQAEGASAAVSAHLQPWLPMLPVHAIEVRSSAATRSARPATAAAGS